MNIYLILGFLSVVLFIAGLWAIFEKAGQKGWYTVIPFFNLYIWLKIIKKPLWWYIFLLIPFINVFMIMLMIVEVCKCFNKFGLGQQALGVIFPFFYLPYLGFSKKEVYTDPDNRPVYKKTAVREWVDAIIFAVIAASIIRIFLVEAYTIPTPSMEKTLLVGDYLFVSKINFGPKVPNTPLSFPFVHHTLPLTDHTQSYIRWPHLSYYRFPGLENIENMDVVVFNYPDGDTVSTKFQSNASYYQLVRQFGRDVVWSNPGYFGDIIYRPVDKRENFIKRCIGIPGDSIKIINRRVYINGREESNPGNRQFKYLVYTDGTPMNSLTFRNIGVTEDVAVVGNDVLEATLSDDALAKLKNFSTVKSIEPVIAPAGQINADIFPHDTVNFHWNVDNFGTIWIPKKGVTIQINEKNIALYRRIIDVFEENDLREENGKIYINGKEATTYTFKMNYYWMMGDNRHNSADSRYWGFVPEDHVVGKAVFVWLSLDPQKTLFEGKIRFNKLFRLVK
ncbi:MAG: signal peptidase I [Syntrophothermus sp.]